VAKQTIITNAMQINTGRAPSGANGAPPIGQAVRVDVFFDSATSDVDISMTAIMQNGCFNTIQCLYIDNSLNPSPVIITIPGIQQRIVVNGLSQSLEPIYASDSACSAPIRVHSDVANTLGFPVSLWFSNVPQPFYSKTGLLNSVKNMLFTLPIGNVDGAHFYAFSLDMTNSMQQFNIPDYRCIFVDNSSGFQHLFINDIGAGATIAVVNPYTIAQFPTLGIGSTLYSVDAYDLANNAPQNNISYGYDVNILMRSFDSSTYFNSVGDSAQYSYSSTVFLGAGGTSTIYPLYSRQRITIFGPSPFSARMGGFSIAATPDAIGNYTINYDIKTTSAIQGVTPSGQNIVLVNGGVAQTLQIKDKF
jgi:hypothetical protein